VRLRLSDPELIDNLRTFLERRECVVVQVDAKMLEVALPHEHHLYVDLTPSVDAHERTVRQFLWVVPAVGV
jgi:hypothetical protein